jgi:hypothetical protein
MRTSNKKVLFKVNNEVVLEEDGDLYLNQIDIIKWKIVEECECGFDDIEVDIVDNLLDLSDDIDVSDNGLIYWKAYYPQPIQGIDCDLVEGSDEFLDAMNSGTILDHIYFVI